MLNKLCLVVVVIEIVIIIVPGPAAISTNFQLGELSKINQRAFSFQSVLYLTMMTVKTPLLTTGILSYIIYLVFHHSADLF